MSGAEVIPPALAEQINARFAPLAVFSLLMVALLSGGVLLWELLSAGPGGFVDVLKTKFAVVLLLIGASAAATLYEMRRRSRGPAGKMHWTSGCLLWALAAGSLVVTMFAFYFTKSADAPPPIPLQQGEVAKKIGPSDWQITRADGQIEIHRKEPDGEITRRIIVAARTPVPAAPPKDALPHAGDRRP